MDIPGTPLRFLLAALVLLVVSVFSVPTALAKDAKVPVIVMLEHKATTGELRHIKGLGGDDLKEYTLIDAVSAKMPRSALASLRAEDFSIRPDRPIRPMLSQVVPLLAVPSVWAMGFDGTGTKVAVIDSGLDHTTPGLFPNVSDEHDFVEGDDYAQDMMGHGTHVAGIIGSNDLFYRGIAPGSTLMPLRVLGPDGLGQESDVISAMEWAVAHDADVINLSIGTYEPGDGTSPMSLAANAAVREGVTVVTAAGNMGPAPQTITSPADARLVITVGATDKSGTIVAPFSSRGPTLAGVTKPDLVTPGWMVISTVPGGMFYPGFGTSASAPQVAGIAALLEQADKPSPEVNKEALKHTAGRLSGYDRNTQGNGLPGAFSAAAYAGRKESLALSGKEETERLKGNAHELLVGQPVLFDLELKLAAAMEREDAALSAIEQGKESVADTQLRAAREKLLEFDVQVEMIGPHDPADLLELSAVAQWHLEKAAATPL